MVNEIAPGIKSRKTGITAQVQTNWNVFHLTDLKMSSIWSCSIVEKYR